VLHRRVRVGRHRSIAVVALAMALVATRAGADGDPHAPVRGGAHARPPAARPAPAPATAPARPGTAPAVAPAPAPAPPVIAVAVPTAVVTDCWEDVRLFYSLGGGTVDYCRGHLGYEPGALDCYQFADRVCSLVSVATGEWSETRSSRPGAVFPCPDESAPPVCPRLTWR